MVRRNRMSNGFSPLLFLGMLLFCKSVQAASSPNPYVQETLSASVLPTEQYVKMREDKLTISGVCQSTYLVPYPDRDPYWTLTANDKIFVRAHNKTYHNQLSKRPVRKGAFFKWAGLYNWFVPLIDDQKALIYKTPSNGWTNRIVMS